MKPSRPLKIISIALCGILLTEAVFAHTPEVNFWKERQRQLPPPAATARPTLQLPAVSSRQFGAICQFGTIRKIIPGAADHKILHIQDVHLNTEAQTNIDHALQQLLSDKQVDLIALEGTAEPIDLAAFKEFPDQASFKKAADLFFAEKTMSGPLHALLTSEAILPPIVGVDDAVHYQANAEAYRRAYETIAQQKHDIENQRKNLAEEKIRVFNNELLAFDRQTESYRSGQMALGDYARLFKPAQTPALRQFLEALAIENSLDYNAVENQRNRVLAQLLQNASEKDAAFLTEASVAYRAGRMSHSDFYAFVANICQKNRIDLKRFPALDAYLRYVLLAQNIDTDTLLAELRDQENRRTQELAKTDPEKKLVAQSRRLYLTGKLTEFALTKAEWTEYKTETAATALLTPFEDFYREAEIRDQKIAGNLLAAIAAHHAKNVVLVTGGFHAEGIQAALKGQTYAAFVPKLTKVEAGQSSAYLSVFAREKTPLEKLFQGEKLFLTPPEWTLPARIRYAARGLSFHVASLRGRIAESRVAAYFTTLTKIPAKFFSVAIKNGKLILRLRGTAKEEEVVLANSSDSLQEEQLTPALIKRSIIVFGWTTAFVVGFWILNMAVVYAAGFNIWGTYLAYLAQPGWKSSTMSALTAVFSGVASRMAGQYISQSKARINLLWDFMFFFFFAAVWRPVHGVFTDNLYRWLDASIPIQNGTTTDILRAGITMSYGYFMSFIYEMGEPIMKFKLAAWDAERKGNMSRAVELRRDGNAKKQWDRVRSGMFGRLVFSFTQNNLSINWVALLLSGYRIPFLFGLGFANQTGRATSSYFTGPRVAPFLVLLSGLGFSIFNFWFVSWQTGMVAVALAIVAYLYFVLRSPTIQDFNKYVDEKQRAERNGPVLAITTDKGPGIHVDRVPKMMANGELRMTRDWRGRIHFKLNAKKLAAKVLSVLLLVAGTAIIFRNSHLPPLPILTALTLTLVGYIATHGNFFAHDPERAIQIVNTAVRELIEDDNETQPRAMWIDFLDRRPFGDQGLFFDDQDRPLRVQVDGEGHAQLALNTKLIDEIFSQEDTMVGLVYLKLSLVRYSFSFEYLEESRRMILASLSDSETDNARTYMATGVAVEAQALLRMIRYLKKTNWKPEQLRQLKIKSGPLKEGIEELANFYAVYEDNIRQGDTALQAAQRAIIFELYVPLFESGKLISPQLNALWRGEIERVSGKSRDIFPYAYDPAYIKIPIVETMPDRQKEESLMPNPTAAELIESVMDKLMRDPFISADERTLMVNMWINFKDHYLAGDPELMNFQEDGVMELSPDKDGNVIFRANLLRISELWRDADHAPNKAAYLSALKTYIAGELIEKTRLHKNSDRLQLIYHDAKRFFPLHERGSLYNAKKIGATMAAVEADALLRKVAYWQSQGWSKNKTFMDFWEANQSFRLGQLLLQSNVCQFFFDKERDINSAPLRSAREIAFIFRFFPLFRKDPSTALSRAATLIADDEIERGNVTIVAPDNIKHEREKAFLFLYDRHYYGNGGSGRPTGVLPFWPQSIFDWANKIGGPVPHIVVGLLGAAEELFFSGALVAGPAWLLKHYTGMPIISALILTSIISGRIFMVMHFGENIYWKDGKLVRGPPDEGAIFVLSAAFRIAFAVSFIYFHPAFAIGLVALAHGPLYNSIFSLLSPKAPLMLRASSDSIFKPNPDDNPAIQFVQRVADKMSNDPKLPAATAKDIQKMIEHMKQIYRDDPGAVIYKKENTQLMAVTLNIKTNKTVLQLNESAFQKLLDESQFLGAPLSLYWETLETLIEAQLIEKLQLHKRGDIFRRKRELLKQFVVKRQDTQEADLELARTFLTVTSDLNGSAFIIQEAFLASKYWDADHLEDLEQKLEHTFLADVLQDFHHALDTYHGRIAEGESPLSAARATSFYFAFFPYIFHFDDDDIALMVKAIAKAEEELGQLFVDFDEEDIQFGDDPFAFLRDPKYLKKPQPSRPKQHKVNEPSHFKNRDQRAAIHALKLWIEELANDMPPADYQLVLNMWDDFVALYDGHPDLATSQLSDILTVEEDRNLNLLPKINFPLLIELLYSPTNDPGREQITLLQTLAKARLIEQSRLYAHGREMEDLFRQINQEFSIESVQSRADAVNVNKARILLARLTNIKAEGFLYARSFLGSKHYLIDHIKAVGAQFPNRKIDPIIDRLVRHRTFFDQNLSEDQDKAKAARKASFYFLFGLMIIDEPKDPLGRAVRIVAEAEKRAGRLTVVGDQLNTTPESFSFILDQHSYGDDFPLPPWGPALGLDPIWRPLVKKANAIAARNKYWYSRFAPHALAGVIGAAEELWYSGVMVAGMAWLLSRYAGIPMTDSVLPLSVVSGAWFAFRHLDLAFHWKEGLLVRGVPSEGGVFLISLVPRIVFLCLLMHTSWWQALIGVALLHGPLYNALLSPWIPGAPLAIAIATGGDAVPSPANRRAVAFVTETAMELMVSSQYGDDVRKMWVDFEQHWTKNPNVFTHEDNFTLLKTGMGNDGAAHLMVNTTAINRILQELENAPEQKIYLKELLKMGLVREIFHFHHEASSVFSVRQTFKLLDDILERAKFSFATDVALQSYAFIQEMNYSGSTGWDLTRMRDTTPQILSPTLMNYWDAAVKERDTYQSNRRDRYDPLEAAQRTILVAKYLPLFLIGRRLPQHLNIIADAAHAAGEVIRFEGKIVPARTVFNFIYGLTYARVTGSVSEAVMTHSPEENQGVQFLMATARRISPDMDAQDALDMQKMLDDFQKNYDLGAPDVFFEGARGIVMSVGVRTDGSVGLSLNMAALTRLAENLSAASAEYRGAVKIFLAGELIQKTHIYQRKETLQEVSFHMARLSRMSDDDKDAVEVARKIIAMLTAVMAESFLAQKQYFERVGWTLEHMNEWAAILAGTELGAALALNLQPARARYELIAEDEPNSFRAAQIAALHVGFIPHLYAEGHSDNKRIMTLLTLNEIEEGRIVDNGDGYTLTRDAYSFIHKPAYYQGNNESQDFFGVMPLLAGLHQDTSYSYSYLIITGLALAAVAVSVYFWRTWKNRPPVMEKVANNIVRLAERVSARKNVPTEKVVADFFAGAPLRMKIGRLFTKETDWETTFNDHDFIEALKTARDESGAELSIERVKLLLAALLRRSPKYAADHTAKDIVYFVRNDHDRHMLPKVVERLGENASLLVFVDKNKFGENIAQNLQQSYQGQNIEFVYAPFDFISHSHIHLAQLRPNLPSDMRSNWKNMLIVRPDELDFDVAALSPDERQKLRTLSLTSFLLGNVPLTVEDQLLLRSIASLLVTRRQA